MCRPRFTWCPQQNTLDEVSQADIGERWRNLNCLLRCRRLFARVDVSIASGVRFHGVALFGGFIVDVPISESTADVEHRGRVPRLVGLVETHGDIPCEGYRVGCNVEVSSEFGTAMCRAANGAGDEGDGVGPHGKDVFGVCPVDVVEIVGGSGWVGLNKMDTGQIRDSGFGWN